jgi:limonene-1,2-epoxide hydrolase
MSTVEQETVLAFFRAHEGHDQGRVARIVELFAEGGSYRTLAWGPPHVGHDAIRAEFEKGFAVLTDLSLEIVTISQTGSTVFIERLESLKVGGKPISVHGCGVAEVDAAGKIVSWARLCRHEGDRIATLLGTCPTSA